MVPDPTDRRDMMAVGKGSLSRAAKTVKNTEGQMAAPEAKAAEVKKEGTPAAKTKKTAAAKKKAPAAAKPAPEVAAAELVPDPQVERMVSSIKCDLPIYLL